MTGPMTTGLENERNEGLRIAYLGPIGTFSYEAALRRFGPGSTLVACSTIGEIFVETQKRNVNYGLVPAENSTDGAITNTLDRLLEYDLLISAEVKLAISHFLLSRGSLDQIKTVYSHPQPLAQCRHWLAEHLPRAAQVESPSTARAAQLARATDEAAISTEAAAELYGVPIIARHIEDVSSNVTRFLVIGEHSSPPSGSDRTAIVFGVDDRAGALWSALGALAENRINLNRIESRPSRRRLWEYVFFVDLDGHPNGVAVGKALKALSQRASFVRVLGSWTVAETA